jgi:hypothetical protein
MIIKATFCAGTPAAHPSARTPGAPQQPAGVARTAARHCAAKRDIRWCWTGVAGWEDSASGVPWGEDLGKGDFGS